MQALAVNVLFNSLFAKLIKLELNKRVTKVNVIEGDFFLFFLQLEKGGPSRRVFCESSFLGSEIEI
jgi:hypothetical protein